MTPTETVRVSPGTVRRTGVDLADTAHRIAYASRDLIGLAPAEAEWAAAAALVRLADAVHSHLGLVSGRTAEAADRLRAAATAYESADWRAVGRTGGW